MNKKMKISNDDIIELYNDGLSCDKISNIYNCNGETIRLRLNRLGVNTSIKNISCIYCKGVTQKFGKLNGKQKFKCNDCGKIFNEDTLKKNKLKNEKYNIMEGLYVGDKLSTTEIAKIMGVSSTVVQRILQSINVTRSVKEGVYNYKYKDFEGDVNKYTKTLNEFIKYKRLVKIETNKQELKKIKFFNLRGLNGVDGAYQLDHKYSIYMGFKNKIDPKIIGNINNLEFIPWEENINKGIKCSISLNELYEKIKYPEKDIKVRVK